MALDPLTWMFCAIVLVLLGVLLGSTIQDYINRASDDEDEDDGETWIPISWIKEALQGELEGMPDTSRPYVIFAVWTNAVLVQNQMRELMMEQMEEKAAEQAKEQADATVPASPDPSE